MKKVLIVLTSHEDLGDTGKKTGFWTEEFASPYYFLKDKGIEITLASPKGGLPPIDPISALPDYQTPATKRFDEDKEAQELLANTLKLDSIKQEDYDGVFYPGGHGPLWDLAEDKNSIALIEAFHNNGKPVASVCHGVGVLKHAKNTDGTPLVKGKNFAGFSNSEEITNQTDKIMPFSLEDELKAAGGIYSKGEDWTIHAIDDGLLITGQNPASSEAVAELLIKKLS